MRRRPATADAAPDAINDRQTRYLYYWLLLAFFLEYARPASFIPFLRIPFLYSAVPMTLLVVTLFAKGLRPAREIFADSLSKWLMAYLGLVFVSLLTADVTLYAWNIFRAVLGYVLLFIVMTRVLTSQERVRGVITVLLISHLFLLSMNLEVVITPDRTHYIEGASFLGDGNDYALSLCLLFPCTIETALGARSRWTKILCWSGMAIVVIAIIATQSRGATLGMAAVFFYLWLRSSRKALTIAGFLVVGLIVLIYAPPAYFNRLGGISNYENDGSAQGRIEAWKSAIWMVSDNPVLGVGAGHFPTAFGTKYRTPGSIGMPWLNAHSIYFQSLGELGLPGITCVLMLLFGNLRATTKLRSTILARAGPTPDAETTKIASTLYLMAGAAVGLAASGAFLSAAYYPHLFVMTGLLVATRNIAARQAGLPVVAPPRARPRRRAPAKAPDKLPGEAPPADATSAKSGSQATLRARA